MSYPEKYRYRTVEYRREGHTLEETKEVFHVTITTIRKWEKQLDEEGTLAKKPVVRPFKKIDPEKLSEYIQAHPDAYIREIAAEFSCCETAVRKALERLHITRKKRRNITRNKTQKK